MKLKSHHNVEASPSESSSSKKSLKRSLPVSFSSIALEKSLQGIHIFFCYRCVQVPVQLLSHLHIQLELSPSQIRIEILMMTIDFLPLKPQEFSQNFRRRLSTLSGVAIK